MSKVSSGQLGARSAVVGAIDRLTAASSSMKSRQRGYSDGGEFLFSLIALVVLSIAAAIYSSWSCSSRWNQSGLSTSWGPIQGCLVQTPSGRWVPDDRVREVDLERKEQPKAEVPR